MANVRNSNTFYIDTQYSSAADELAVKNIKVVYAIVTATASSGRVVLGDSSIATKIDLREAVSGTTAYFDFSNKPLVFSTSIRPTTLSNAVVTLVIEETRA